jgi:alpha-glucoside transport system permease protein
VWLLYYAINRLVETLPDDTRDKLRPYVFVGPALIILTVFLVYPALNTIVLSFMDARSENFVGLDNFVFAFTDESMQVALRNNALWLIIVTSVSVSLGLIFAVLVDRIGKWEPLAKSLIFLPMAISAVGASVIWRFMYDAKPASRPQIGLLNAILIETGSDPVLFLNEIPLNTFALMVIMIWLVTGFCVVVISAAVKGVADEILEAARIDGAGEVRVFFSIIIPSIRTTLITVGTTVFIMVLKVFDIVYVMTNGRRETEVIANRMFNEFYRNGNYGRGSVLAVVLLIILLPFLYLNLRDLRRQKG